MFTHPLLENLSWLVEQTRCNCIKDSCFSTKLLSSCLPIFIVTSSFQGNVNKCPEVFPECSTQITMKNPAIKIAKMVSKLYKNFEGYEIMV